VEAGAVGRRVEVADQQPLQDVAEDGAEQHRAEALRVEAGRHRALVLGAPDQVHEACADLQVAGCHELPKVSGLTSAPELLPQPWGAVGQLLPPGATGTLLRSVAFFDGAGGAVAAWVLGAWAAGGLLLAAIAGRSRLRLPVHNRSHGPVPLRGAA